MEATIKTKAVNHFYTEYIIEFSLEVGLVVAGWCSLLIGSFSMEIADVVTQTATVISNTNIVNHSITDSKLDTWIHRVSGVSGIILPLSSFLIVWFKKNKK